MGLADSVIPRGAAEQLLPRLAPARRLGLAAPAAVRHPGHRAPGRRHPLPRRAADDRARHRPDPGDRHPGAAALTHARGLMWLFCSDLLQIGPEDHHMTISLDRDQRTRLPCSRSAAASGPASTASASAATSPTTDVAAIRAALLRHKVVFFRGQDHLDDAGQVAFAERMGTLTTAHPTVNTGSAHVLQLAATQGMAANSWHTDVTFVDRVPGHQHPARRHHPAVRRHHGVGEHGGGVRGAAARPARARRPALGGAHQRLRLRRRRGGPGGRRARARRPRPPAVPLDGPTRPSTRWCACTPRPTSARCCSATS